MNRITLSVLAVIAALLVGGCAVAAPDPAQMSLTYKAGPLTAENFDSCQTPGSRVVQGVNDNVFYYPVGQRTYRFADGEEGADAPSLRVTTSNNVELLVKGTITFTLNTDCAPFTDRDGREWKGGIIQKFHDTIGRHKAAYGTEGENGGEPGVGWDNSLDLYIGSPLERSSDLNGKRYQWQALYNNPALNTEWQNSVVGELPRLIEEQAGGAFFQINNIQMEAPQPPPEIVNQLRDAEAAALRAQTAAIDTATSAAFPGGINGWLAYEQQKAINKAIVDGKVQILPVPQGAPVIVQPR